MTLVGTQTGTTAIRVVLVESSAVLRAALREYLLRHSRDIDIVGETDDADEAVQQVLANKPDVVVLDLNMSETPGWESAKRIHRAAPETQILLVSLGPTGLSPQEMREYGICTTVPKAELTSKLLEMIRRCARGSCDLPAL